jgi:3-methyladenine DNA glycosylase AlkD
MARTAIDGRVDEAVALLKRHATRATRDGMARYGIPSGKALGVPVGTLHRLAKQLGRDHALALGLWKTDIYEARMLCAFVDEPERVTAAQMDRWASGFDSWAICDTLCFHLFDRAPQAWGRIGPWSRRRDEFVRRAAFALLASLGAPDREAADSRFLRCLPLVERAASDERNFVKKGVSWALRMLGQRNAALNAAATEVARRLAASSDAAERWVGREALREFARPAVRRRLAARARAAGPGTLKK